jgi:hypothetical protein
MHGKYIPKTTNAFLKVKTIELSKLASFLIQVILSHDFRLSSRWRDLCLITPPQVGGRWREDSKLDTKIMKMSFAEGLGKDINHV